MIESAHFGYDGTGLKPEADQLIRKWNYELCTAINMIKLGIVLDEMVTAGHLDRTLALAYRANASALLAILRSENFRSFSGPEFKR